MNEWCKDGFYSEYGEDKFIAENLPLPDRGVYVDVGAGHPYYANNTAFLRERGWVGLSIDGNPRCAQLFESPFVCAVIAAESHVRFKEAGLLSRIDPRGVERFAVPLQALLDQANIGRIDLLSIDIEGAEFDAFQTFDLERHQPEIIIGEYSSLGLCDDFRLRDHLLARGYRVAHQTVANLIYVRT